jgi:hypothetical protein
MTHRNALLVLMPPPIGWHYATELTIVAAYRTAIKVERQGVTSIVLCQQERGTDAL